MNEYVPLTIAIPTYNRCKSVMSVVKAIVPQLQPEDELLVVDDGSQDGTADSLRIIPQVRLLRSPTNQGMTKTWNACLISASCDWVCMVHDDDVVAPNALNTVRQACALACGPALIGHQNVGADLDSSFRYRILEPGPWAVLHSSLTPSGITIHRAIIDSIGSFDERFLYSPDIEYFARVCARYKSIVIESPPVLYHNLHDRNYQYRTWRELDFLSQLEEIERFVVANSGLTGDVAAGVFRHRMNMHCIHMLRTAGRADDRLLLRRIGRMLCAKPYLGRRVRAMACMAAVLNWCPTLL